RRGFWVGYQENGRNRLGITNGDEGEATQVAWNGEPNLLEVVYLGSGRWAQYLNGEPDGSGVFGARTFLGFRSDIRLAIGQHYGATHPNTWYVGDLAEVLLYNRVLSASEQNVLGNYLTQKYRLDTNYGPALRFEKDIAPIFAKRCYKCHGAETREAELDLRTVSAMLKGGERGAVLVRGYPENSELLEMITAGKMPPENEPPLTRKEIANLRRWIKLGAPADERIELPSAAALVSQKDRQHPAYQKLKRPNPPRVQQPDRVRTPIDAFLLARLEERGLSFSPEAGRTTLARRAWFDLIGLPPSPSELTEFLEDKRPDAYERLVSRLLDSPHFGERWGRHWLDAAGYVDVYGSDNDAATIKTLAGKWRYRDYVVQSFNQDKPFDRFLVEQLAGDELFDWRSAKSFTPEMRDALIATGFLLCAADSTGSPELNTPDIRHRVLQVTGEIVASNLLALTVNCAKCHNHKYEAIPQIDYYRWMAVFSPAFNPQRWVIATGHEVKDPSLGKIQVVYEHHPPSPTFLLRRGNHLKPGTEVHPGLLTVLSEGEKGERLEQEGGSKLLHDSSSREEPRHDDSERRPTVVVKLPRTSALKQSSGRRLALARELTNPRTRASALMARVMVNRIWQHLFGKGIVATSENFGVSGAPPTHPELLEWLAAEWIEGGWRTKPLIRRIMTSRAYRQSSIRGVGTASKDNSAADSVDPDNSLYWRMSLRRLEAEAIRDSILTASGKLDASLG
ncbi:MAG: DUF1549 domain-containing protein, partial [Planctomycetes bacterium]|nr:DUF1549 domain-containing protein [Planctomycetota bacterium]